MTNYPPRWPDDGKWAEAARQSDCVCGTEKQRLCTDDVEMNQCAYCKTLDMYAPCPVQGFGCGPGCDCCTPEQQKAATL